MPDAREILVYCMVVRPHQAFAGLPRNIGSLHTANGRGFLVRFPFGFFELLKLDSPTDIQQAIFPVREYAMQFLISVERTGLKIYLFLFLRPL